MSITVASFLDVAGGLQPKQFSVGSHDKISSLDDLDPMYKQLLDKPIACVLGLIGNDGLEADLPLYHVIDEVKQRYHLYVVIPGGACHGGDRDVLTFWTRHVGKDHVIRLQSPEDTSECIALTIGMNEGAITADDGVAQLRKRGVVSRAIDRVAWALVGV